MCILVYFEIQSAPVALPSELEVRIALSLLPDSVIVELCQACAVRDFSKLNRHQAEVLVMDAFRQAGLVD